MDEQYAKDPGMKRRVDVLLNEMEIEQDLVALREQRGLSQRELAKRLGVSQPAVAKIESGKIKNIELKTLVRYVAALEARVRIEIVKDRVPQRVVALKVARAKA